MLNLKSMSTKFKHKKIKFMIEINIKVGKLSMFKMILKIMIKIQG